MGLRCGDEGIQTCSPSLQWAVRRENTQPNPWVDSHPPLTRGETSQEPGRDRAARVRHSFHKPRRRIFADDRVRLDQSHRVRQESLSHVTLFAPDFPSGQHCRRRSLRSRRAQGRGFLQDRELRDPREARPRGRALEFMPDGKLAVSTRRGDIYLVDKPISKIPPRSRDSIVTPMDSTKCSAWRTATDGSTSPSAASFRESRTATATASPTDLRRSPTSGRLAAIIMKCVWIKVRSRRLSLGRPLPDRFVHEQGQVPRLVPAGLHRRQGRPHVQRPPLPGGIGMNAAGDMSTRRTKVPGTAHAA